MADSNVVVLDGKCPGCGGPVKVSYRSLRQNGSFRFYRTGGDFPTCSPECAELHRIMQKQKSGAAVLSRQEIADISAHLRREVRH